MDSILEFRSAFIKPDYLSNPLNWAGHIPFAFWLMDTLKPDIFLELGTHTGNSYFAFCQGIRDHKLPTKSFAVDTWQGDEHAGYYGDEVYSAVHAYNQEHYHPFSTLMRMTFDDAINYFENASVDLLHIDGLHTYDAVKHDFENWLPKMSESGIVLFHDTNVHERNFGVWRLFGELSDIYPSISFDHSYGLGVLFTGTQQCDAIKELLENWYISERQAFLKSFFLCIADRNIHEFHFNELSHLLQKKDHLVATISEEIHQLHFQLQGELMKEKKLSQQITALTHENSERNKQLKKLITSSSWRITKPLRKISNSAKKRINRIKNLYQMVRGYLPFDFNVDMYLKLNPDVKEAGVNPIDHYCLYGKKEGRVYCDQHDISSKVLALYSKKNAFPMMLRLDDLSCFFYKKAKKQSNSYSLRNQVVSSYQAWSQHFDTPSPEIMSFFARESEYRTPVLVIAFFDKQSENYADLLAKRLINSVGQPWLAIFIFLPGSEASQIMEDIRISTNNDRRIFFDLNQDLQNTKHAILIEGGALPRPHALRVFVDALNNSPETLVAYSDEDRYFNENILGDPWFKPKFSKLLIAQGVMLGRMIAFRQMDDLSYNIKNEIFLNPGNRFGIVLDYTLSAGEKRVLHIPHVLFHDVFEPQQAFLPKLTLPKTLPTVTIIIPTKDRGDLLGPCLDSLLKTDWQKDRLEVIVVDNGSTDPYTLKMLRIFEISGKIRVISVPEPFNYSRLNNIAVKQSHSNLLVFLNNDTEVYDALWLKKMAIHAICPDVGAVGCKLLYPDKKVQHGGVIAGIQGVAGHAHLFLDENEGGYRNLANTTHEVIAVTGACLVVERKKFDLAKGFNEDFRVAFNDTALCFELNTLGLKNIYVSDPLIIHKESKSRGYDDTPEKKDLNYQETMKIWALYPSLMKNDPYYSPNLSLVNPYELSFAPRRRNVWDNKADRPLRVMILSITHAIGHGVPVVISLQAEALVNKGYDVYIGGPKGNHDYPYPGCTRVEVNDPVEAAVIAANFSIDVIIAQTPPFFSVARWTGAYPSVICYDHGEPPPEYFPDADHRRAVNKEKDLSLRMATALYAISDAVAAESRVPVNGVILEGNTHLGQWNDDARNRRQHIRQKKGWEGNYIVLTVCRFQEAERLYKGVDTYVSVYKKVRSIDKHASGKVIFVLCGKGSPNDVNKMTKQGLSVHANVTDNELLDLYCAADAYASFSKWEGYNLGIAQALAMGLPVIASDIPAHKAFNVDIADDVDNAATWVIKKMKSSEERSAKILDWEPHFAKLIEVISSHRSDVCI